MPSQWETPLQSNAISHWLGANLESALISPCKALTITWKLSWCQLCHQRQHQSFSMIISWHGKTFSHYWSFVRGAHKSLVASLHKKMVIMSFDIFFVVIQNTLLNKQLTCWWSDRSWHSCDGTIHYWQKLASLQTSLCHHKKHQSLSWWQRLVSPNKTKLASWQPRCCSASHAEPRIYWLKSAVLTHWGLVMHICVNKLTIIGSENGLSPSWWLVPNHYLYQWCLWIRPLGTNFSEK